MPILSASNLGVIINKTRFRAWYSVGPHSGKLVLTSVVNHEDMDGTFPFLPKWEAYIIQVNIFLVQ